MEPAAMAGLKLAEGYALHRAACLQGVVTHSVKETCVEASTHL